MPEPKASLNSELSLYVKLFGWETFDTDGTVLMRKVCEKTVNAQRKYFIQQHIRSSNHIRRKDRVGEPDAEQVVLSNNFVAEQSDRKKSFIRDLCKVLLEVNTPLSKIQNPSFRSFMEKYTNQSLPHRSTLRKIYLKDVYDGVISRIREAIGSDIHR
ncbi:CGG triplet repeat-binding protein 1-like [Galendromus occidentalis]|uniref:CGG triplet repeat-binding protein 1-like n=1 Tax=Galendromus occidentalis TaxID=34638 RepID=A0AAJ6QY82_9ACAR|nr:CGG triplet repeat-binding protein 1-like [Galendromus occidentalis]